MKKIAILLTLSLALGSGCKSSSSDKESTSTQEVTEQQSTEQAQDEPGTEEQAANEEPKSEKTGKADIFAPFEKAYQDAVQATKDAKPLAEKAIADASAELKRIQKSTENWPDAYQSAEAETKQALASIEAALEKAAAQVEKDTQKARKALAPIEADLKELRAIGKDDGTSLAASLDRIAESAQTEPVNWEKEKKQVDELEKDYELVKADLPESDHETCGIADIDDALGKVRAAVTRNDSDAYKKATKNLKDEFTDYFENCENKE